MNEFKSKIVFDDVRGNAKITKEARQKHLVEINAAKTKVLEEKRYKSLQAK